MKRNITTVILSGVVTLCSAVVLVGNVYAKQSESSLDSSISNGVNEQQSSSVISNSETPSVITSTSRESESETEQKKKVISESDNNLVSDGQIGPGFYDNKVKKTAEQNFQVFRSALSALPASLQSNFLSGIKSGAIDSWKRYKVLPSVTAAQAILESGWGQSQLAQNANNLFGIKGRYNNQYVLMPTQEFVNGHYITIQAEFRKYNSQSESLVDHGEFLQQNSRYSNLLGVTDYKTVTYLLQADGYATAPTYASSLNRIIEQYGLTAWDKEAMQPNNTGFLDNLYLSNDMIRVQGWSVTSSPYNKPYSFLFAMDTETGRELMRWSITRVNRPDVQNAVIDFPNSLTSGFDSMININDKFAGKKIKIMARYSSGTNGDGDNQDFTFDNTLELPEKKTIGFIDNIKQQGNSLWVQGWQVGTYTQSRPYRYLFVMNKQTNTQVASVKITNEVRQDVGRANPTYTNAAQGGFNVKIPLTKAMRNKKVYVIARYTPDVNGNNDGLDFSANQNIAQIR